MAEEMNPCASCKDAIARVVTFGGTYKQCARCEAYVKAEQKAARAERRQSRVPTITKVTAS